MRKRQKKERVKVKEERRNKMQIENKAYFVPNQVDFQIEMRKLSEKGEAMYLGNIEGNVNSGVYHMYNTTIIAESGHGFIIGQLIEIERTKKNLENKLNIKLKEKN